MISKQHIKINHTFISIFVRNFSLLPIILINVLDPPSIDCKFSNNFVGKATY